MLPLLLLLLVCCCAVSAKGKHKSGKTGGSRAGKRSVSPARRRDTKTVPASAGTREVHVHFRRGRRASRRLHARIVRIKGPLLSFPESTLNPKPETLNSKPAPDFLELSGKGIIAAVVSTYARCVRLRMHTEEWERKIQHMKSAHKKRHI